ncbi:MAG: hypothetical protein QNJ12_21420 [Ilumatobacter sp.]|uniref:hypothetical protein n=1 Tax=Ilumatobacter sp. TaxID=1967498 RepID=UPI002610510C|nr:hypothetical protein [Ilumatobacter sp.]MDJ0771360.1 hypothetical protein [Ilumatobacter sp.]
MVEPHELDRFVNPGAVVVDGDGVFHMFRNSFLRYPGTSVTWHLTSLDGVEWTVVGEAPVMTSEQVTYADGNVFVFAAYVTDDGTWVGFFDTFDGTGEPGFIGRMTAPGPDGPWVVDPQPVLEPGPEGAWDADRVSEPSLIIDGGELVMFYTGAASRTSAIGRATSLDGLVWTKHDDPLTTEPLLAESDPVLEPPDWAARSVAGAQVVRSDTEWRMLFHAPRTFDVGLATSADGVEWTTGTAFTDASELPTGTETYQSELLLTDGEYLWWQEVGKGSSRTAVYALSLPEDAW